VEKTNDEYSCFFASNILKKAVVREWNILSTEIKKSLSLFIFEYLIQKKKLKHVNNQLLHCLSIIQKKGWIEKEGYLLQVDFCTKLQTLLNQPNYVSLGLDILDNTIVEFSITKNIIDISLEDHEKSRLIFQVNLQLIQERSVTV
jgi:hypothetical protein